MDIIYNPTQEVVDDELMRLNTLREEYKEVYKELSQLDFEEAQEVNRVCNELYDNGKKKFTYKNQAESFVQEENIERTKRINDLKISKKLLELDDNTCEKNYYH